MRSAFASWLPLLAVCSMLPLAPDGAAATPTSYAQALQDWRTPEQISAWAGQHFRYDPARAEQLSETNRRVATPPAFT